MTDILGVPWWAWVILAFEACVWLFTFILLWTYWDTINVDLRNKLHPPPETKAPPV
jgi:hypothetical protein